MNTHKKTLSSLLLSALLLVAATPFPGRTEDAKPSAPAVTAPQKETAAAKKETAAKEVKTAPTDPIAKVGTQTITRAELDRAISVLVAQNRIPQATSPEQRKQVETFATEQLVSAEILFQEGLKNPPKDLNKQIEDKIAQGRAKFSTPAEFDAALKGANLTEKELREITRKDIVINNFVEKELASGIKVTDEEIKKFYDENKDKFQKDAQIRASHILCGIDANASADDKKKAKEKATELLKKIKAGEDFAKLAKDNSTCPSSAQGGDLGLFGKGQMVPSFEQAAFALKPGEVSDVVETQFGYHIIKLTEKKDAELVKLDEVKERIGDYLKNQKVQKAVVERLTSLKGKYKVEILP
jgi:peptidyl-prolyl cis-trans isomerase C